MWADGSQILGMGPAHWVYADSWTDVSLASGDATLVTMATSTPPDWMNGSGLLIDPGVYMLMLDVRASAGPTNPNLVAGVVPQIGVGGWERTYVRPADLWEFGQPTTLQWFYPLASQTTATVRFQVDGLVDATATLSVRPSVVQILNAA
jgi:hypothetical protein